VKKFVLWYIDNRQVEYGDFGGGISDDVDLLNTWPGCRVDGLRAGEDPEIAACTARSGISNGMFTAGLPTIQADELHSNEEGIGCLNAKHGPRIRQSAPIRARDGHPVRCRGPDRHQRRGSSTLPYVLFQRQEDGD